MDATNSAARKALNNYLHPRTDPVVIILAVSPDNDKILLGRNVRRISRIYAVSLTSDPEKLAEEFLFGSGGVRGTW